MCELYVEELPRTSKLIKQWLLYTNSRRTQVHGLTLIPFCVVTACVEMNPLRIPLVWTFRLLDSNCIFRSSEIWFEIIIFNKTIRTFLETYPYFRSRSTLQLSSTEYNFRPRSTTSVNICFTTIPQSLLLACMSLKRSSGLLQGRLWHGRARKTADQRGDLVNGSFFKFIHFRPPSFGPFL